MASTVPKRKSPANAKVKESTFPVVAIGASAGGLEAMMEFLKFLPADTGMAFIYVQHMSPDHKSMLTEILSKKTSMIVQEIDQMDTIKPNNVFVIPYNKGIEVTDGHIKLIPRSESGVAISIDILFTSLAKAQKERVIGIILSGSAGDGTKGIKAIKEEGGLTFAQDDSAKFTSMPHSAISAGMVDYILSPKEIALELARLGKHPLIKKKGVKNAEEDLIENGDPALKNILKLLHKNTGVDFSTYKMNTIKRRIIRRMLLYKLSDLKDYAKLLSQKNEEIDILYQDLLISVTSFFRDSETHKYLKEKLFPKLLNQKSTGESLRIWVPACATGEEVYSIAMMLHEIQDAKTTNIPIQIFATDLSEKAIHKARAGVYTKEDLETVSPKRIQRFFIKELGSYRVNKAIREMCVFAPHNVLHDPPFSRLDFISCCNLFIYFDTAAQKKAVSTFHYALKEDGYLMLGKSENISHSANLFTAFNKKYKIFSRKINLGARVLPALTPRFLQQSLSETSTPVSNNRKSKQTISIDQNGLDSTIDSLLVSDFMPACVVINQQMEIVQFRGATELFLTHPKGKATFNILKMARPEIAFELRNAIAKIIRTKHRYKKSGIELKINSDVKIISLEIVPLKIELDESLMLILFTEQEITENFWQQEDGDDNNSQAKDRRIIKLEQELASAHADAHAIAQDQEAFAEELQSASEEVVSSNEELQTVNEELETSKEEIESANEELTTTNQELQTRNDLLNEAYDYSEALFATIHEPMLVLDKNLRVKSANKTFYKTFGVDEQDTEGLLLYDLGNKQWNIPRLKELLEDLLPKNTHFHDFEITHTFPLIGEKTMLLNARRIIQKTNHEELILLAISDVTEQATARKKIEESEQRFRRLVEQASYPILILKGEDLTLELANEPLFKIWNIGKEAIGKPFLEILPEMKDQPFTGLLLDVLHNSNIHYGTEQPAYFIRLNGEKETIYFNFVYQPYKENDGTVSGVIVFAIDVTTQVLAFKKLEESEEQLRKTKEHFEIATTAATIGIWTLDIAKQTLEWSDLHKKMWGYSNLETNLKYEDWHKLIVPEDKETAITALAKALKTKTLYEVSYRIKLADNGDIRWINSTGQYFYNDTGEPITLTGVSIDITEQKLFEKELIAAKESAENAMKSKQLFLSNMSHEIRTPLNSILGFANVLVKTDLNKEQLEFLNAIKTSGKSLNLLINDILDLAKVNEGKMTFENKPFEIDKTIDALLYSFDLKMKEKNLKLVKEYDNKIPSMLLGDAIRLNQIILNLMSNAVKFTNKGNILLSVKRLHEDEENVTIEFAVTDTGIGIAANKIKLIFNLFEQADPFTSNVFGGTGLGLTIVKQLIEAQGGSIDVMSKVDEGSTFCFTMTFGKTNIKLEEDIELPKLRLENNSIRILVAEDVALNQLLIKIILSDFGFAFEIVDNGKMVLEKLKTNTYDIILMDLHMPEKNGFETTQYIRKTLKSKIPIIALTADVATADLAKCKTVGMDDYVSKPIDESLLYNKIMTLVKKKREN